MAKKKGYYGYIELFIIYTLILIVDIYGKYFGYAFIDPNPYFIFSLFIAIRYGINLALVSGFLSTAYLFFSLYIQAKENFTGLIVSWQILKIPLFTFSLSFIIGFFRDMYIQEIENRDERIKVLNEKVKDLENEIRKYKNVTVDLEKKLVLERKGVSLLVERLKEIDYESAEDIFNESIDLIFDFIEATTVSIYTLSKNNFLRMRVRKGPQYLPNSFDIEKSVVISMAKEFGAANVNVLYLTEMEYNFEFEPAMAVSISAGKNILGFVIIELIDPEKVNKNTETYLKILSDWLSTLLMASKELAESDEEMFIKPYEEFEITLKYIEERRKRFEIPYSIIYFTVTQNVEIEKYRKIIRDTDFVFYDPEDKKGAIILTSCGKTGLKRVLENIEKIKSIKVLEAYSKE
ncbi:hypothetical protein XO10_08990 [Marinitoga sp. 1135]|uniref:GAF domain-containing protein n=1 Tax=Marinitoga piezophila (strain DSM 14283 / JCM 11233 / KA3) TaxID=443254 RepID=H2J5Y3_MARPK|nr:MULTISPECIES: hypothetical protein [Marinitoga]AEX86202.1 hypothetical protein Marpi_1821 [Marinitoga piezophila KA3]APT76615.1 hypothetical protein LN42_09670 [Marinitoga sp. 1137]NUU96390.1 hypothetical protein [Marinitoga sp. 1135]NUU98312.1 hypothetical protein [Marinitoga sp. 1138]